jgi:tripartite-type tricarboxylate transporter receptor subunit TctC
MSAKRNFLCKISAAWCAILFASIVAAQPYPTRPVKFIVAFPPGGSTDVGARVIAEYL